MLRQSREVFSSLSVSTMALWGRRSCVSFPAFNYAPAVCKVACIRSGRWQSAIKLSIRARTGDEASKKDQEFQPRGYENNGAASPQHIDDDVSKKGPENQPDDSALIDTASSEQFENTSRPPRRGKSPAVKISYELNWRINDLLNDEREKSLFYWNIYRAKSLENYPPEPLFQFFVDAMERSNGIAQEWREYQQTRGGPLRLRELTELKYVPSCFKDLRDALSFARKMEETTRKKLATVKGRAIATGDMDLEDFLFIRMLEQTHILHNIDTYDPGSA